MRKLEACLEQHKRHFILYLLLSLSSSFNFYTHRHIALCWLSFSLSPFYGEADESTKRCKQIKFHLLHAGQNHHVLPASSTCLCSAGSTAYTRPRPRCHNDFDYFKRKKKKRIICLYQLYNLKQDSERPIKK